MTVAPRYEQSQVSTTPAFSSKMNNNRMKHAGGGAHDPSVKIEIEVGADIAAQDQFLTTTTTKHLSKKQDNQKNQRKMPQPIPHSTHEDEQTDNAYA